MTALTLVSHALCPVVQRAATRPGIGQLRPTSDCDLFHAAARSARRHGSTLARATPILARPPLTSTAVPNTPHRNRVLRNYLLGIASIVIGAGVTSATDSLLPIAMGGAVAVMCTYSLVRAICRGEMRAAKRR